MTGRLQAAPQSGLLPSRRSDEAPVSNLAAWGSFNWRASSRPPARRSVDMDELRRRGLGRDAVSSSWRPRMDEATRMLRPIRKLAQEVKDLTQRNFGRPAGVSAMLQLRV